MGCAIEKSLPSSRTSQPATKTRTSQEPIYTQISSLPEYFRHKPTRKFHWKKHHSSQSSPFLITPPQLPTEENVTIKHIQEFNFIEVLNPTQGKIMTKFVILNIQLLPNSNDIREVGALGYKRLFAKLREENDKNKANRQLANFHYTISKDLFFGPKTFHVHTSYFYGEFSKYRTTEQVTVINSGKQVFKNSSGNTAASHENVMPYIFDAKTHHLCIEQGGLKSEAFIEAFTHLLDAIAKSEFPNHQLTINTLNKREGYEEVVNSATGYKTVSVSLTFKNGESESQELLKQLKDTKTKFLKINASGGDGKMNALPAIIREAADAAFEGTGNVSLSYYDSNGRLQQYNAKDNPITFQKNRASSEDDLSFFKKVHNTLLEIIKGVASTHNGAES